ncbi:MAG: triose-phosphate isomerase [Calditrichota bacterium]|jgi:triosephosphate isomerase
MPKKIIAGNWKMYKTNTEAVRLVKQLDQKLKKSPARKSGVVVFPPFTALSVVSDELKGSRIETGAQNLFWEEEGAFTGEISAKMIKSTGAKWVIIGHSERRQYFKEEEKVINRKIKIALMNKLKVIFCVGETLEMREQNLTKDIVINQVEWGLKGLKPEFLKNVVIAYEPVWAIGTGKTATPKQAQEIHALVRDILVPLFDEKASRNMTILYGGSVKPENAIGLFAQKDIDGALVGGACLKADSFYKIIKAGEKTF